MKRHIKLIILIVFFIIIISAFNNVFAYDIPSAKPYSNSDLTKIGGTIISVLSVVGSISSVVVLIIIGIKYMLGSIEEKATYKKSLLPYVIGCVILFGASSIASIIYNLVKDI